ncbi:MAG: peptidylprolyl isomerase [Oscillospiraceae bacterium]|nr:peptidylprolyl isomerase [Oscillospiraceae bacterium]
MKCKFCEAELEEGMTVCPACNACQSEESVQQESAQDTVETSMEETQEEVAMPAEEAAVAEETIADEETAPVEEPAEQVSDEIPAVVAEAKPKAKVKAWQVIVGVLASLVVLAALAIVLLTAFGVDLRPKANDIFKKETYTVSDQKAIRAGDKAVAEVNGVKLTNTMLQMFYRMQVLEYLNANADYISYLGIDLEKPFAEQPSYEDETLSWEQFFLKSALETWYNYQCIYSLAMEEEYVPSEALEKSLQELPASMEELAKDEGFETGDALIADRFGAGCTIKDYEAYCRMYYVSAEYINITPSAQQLEDYFTANKDMFDQYGIGKDSGAIVNVRHILVCPEGGTTNEETKEVTYSKAEWEACLKKAEAIYNEWKNGEATEESFATLATQKSEDGGSNTNGGLYTGITKDTNFVEPFLNWCMDASREVGNTGIVKTDYGYHIMFFAHSQPQWEYYANTYYLSEYTTQKVEAGRAKWPMEVNYKQIVLSELHFD